MNAASKGGLFTGGLGLFVILVDVWSNDSLLSFFNGVSYTGTPISPLIVLVFGALLVLYGILSVIGVLPKKYEWQ